MRRGMTRVWRDLPSVLRALCCMRVPYHTRSTSYPGRNSELTNTFCPRQFTTTPRCPLPQTPPKHPPRITTDGTPCIARITATRRRRTHHRCTTPSHSTFPQSRSCGHPRRRNPPRSHTADMDTASSNSSSSSSINSRVARDSWAARAAKAVIQHSATS
jgi:hypothetical protein